MVNALLNLIVVAVGCLAIWFLLKWLFRPVKRIYYSGKSIFRGKYFHQHYIDEDGRLQIVYRTDFGLRFWTLMGRIYGFCVFMIPLFFLMVRLDGTNGYALAESRYRSGDVVMYYDVSEMRSNIGSYVSNSNTLVIENDAGENIEISGFVIGKYYREPLTPVSVPGLFVRSVAANVKTATHHILKTFF